jgi:hypothetical protein
MPGPMYINMPPSSDGDRTHQSQLFSGRVPWRFQLQLVCLSRLSFVVLTWNLTDLVITLWLQ